MTKITIDTHAKFQILLLCIQLLLLAWACQGPNWPLNILCTSVNVFWTYNAVTS